MHSSTHHGGRPPRRRRPPVRLRLPARSLRVMPRPFSVCAQWGKRFVLGSFSSPAAATGEFVARDGVVFSFWGVMGGSLPVLAAKETALFVLACRFGSGLRFFSLSYFLICFGGSRQRQAWFLRTDTWGVPVMVGILWHKFACFPGLLQCRAASCLGDSEAAPPPLGSGWDSDAIPWVLLLLRKPLSIDQSR